MPTTEATRAQISATELSLGSATQALELIFARGRTDAETVQSLAVHLELLGSKLQALGAGAAMEEVQSQLNVARKAVEKLGRSELSSIKTMKEPPPTIKRVITAVYLLLNAKLMESKFGADANAGRVEWGGGTYSCQGMLGRRTFADDIITFDTADLCETPLLLAYVSENFVGKAEDRQEEDKEEAGADVSPVASPVRGPPAEQVRPASKLAPTVLFGRRANSPTRQPQDLLPRGAKRPGLSFGNVASLTVTAARVTQKAQSRREKRDAEWAEVGWSTTIGPKRLTYDEVAYASQACGALYLWATTAVDTALALQASPSDSL